MNGERLLRLISESNVEIVNKFKLDKLKEIDKVDWFSRVRVNSSEKQIIFDWFEWFKERDIPCILIKGRCLIESNYKGYIVYKEPFEIED